MTNYTIIGLGRIGTSLGMAIRSKGGHRVVGYDSDNTAQSLAQRMGAVDETEWNLDKAVSDADVVIAATPAGALYDVFDGIASYLKAGSVVTDTSPSKRSVIEWAHELLPSNVDYVGGNPLTGASIKEQKDASGYIFHNAKWAVVAPPNAGQQSIRAIIDLIENVGAKPVFMDAHEHDSFSAATSGLPAVVSAAVMNVVSSSPSWAEISRFVGADFDNITAPASGDPASSQSSAATNADMLAHWIDQLIERFQAIKEGLIDDEARFSSDGILADSFVQAWEQRARLEAGVADRRPESEERASIPSSSDSMMGMFFGSRIAKLMGNNKEKKKDSTTYDRRRMN